MKGLICNRTCEALSSLKRIGDELLLEEQMKNPGPECPRSGKSSSRLGRGQKVTSR